MGIMTKQGFKELSPVQGGVINDMSFDVNNIRKGWVTAGFLNKQDTTYMFGCYEALTGVTNVWKRTWDDFGFDYKSTRNGWLVMLYPYDKKFKIQMDSRPVEFYRANYSFLAFPITKGDHKILVQYWPQTHLRIFIGISVVTAMVLLFYIVMLCLRPAHMIRGSLDSCKSHTATDPT